MSNYIKDPEEVLKQSMDYKYAIENTDVTILSSVVTIFDSSDNNVTSGILVADSITIDNTKKVVNYYIQGGAEGAKFDIVVKTTFSDAMVLEDNYYMKISKQYTYLNKTALEILPIVYNYKDAFNDPDNTISSYTVQCFKNNILVNNIISTDIVDSEVTAMMSGGAVGDRFEIVFKVVGSDETTVLVDRAYMDIK